MELPVGKNQFLKQIRPNATSTLLETHNRINPLTPGGCVIYIKMVHTDRD